MSVRSTRGAGGGSHCDDRPCEHSPVDDEAVVIPIDGTLDLHTFRPRELGELVPEYLVQCRAAGILQVRIVHGKGRGELRRSVHTLLQRIPEVVRFELAEPHRGGWGATVVYLSAADDQE